MLRNPSTHSRGVPGGVTQVMCSHTPTLLSPIHSQVWATLALQGIFSTSVQKALVSFSFGNYFNPQYSRDWHHAHPQAQEAFWFNRRTKRTVVHMGTDIFLEHFSVPLPRLPHPSIKSFCTFCRSCNLFRSCGFGQWGRGRGKTRLLLRWNVLVMIKLFLEKFFTLYSALRIERWLRRHRSKVLLVRCGNCSDKGEFL